MDRLVIRGGRRLQGSVEVRPAKNALLPCMAACLLTPDPVTFETTAELIDIYSMKTLLGTALNWTFASLSMASFNGMTSHLGNAFGCVLSESTAVGCTRT